MTLNEFEEIKNKHDRQELLIKDENGKVIRECKIICLDNYYEWDKNDKQDYPPKCRWNGKDVIWNYYTTCDISCCDDILILYSKEFFRPHKKHIVRIKRDEGYRVYLGVEELNYDGRLLNMTDFKNREIVERTLKYQRDKINKMNCEFKKVLLEFIDKAVIYK